MLTYADVCVCTETVPAQAQAASHMPRFQASSSTVSPYLGYPPPHLSVFVLLY
jgi:hypothetical protein